MMNHLLTRRDLLTRCGTGFGALALGGLMSQLGLTQAAPLNPLTPKQPHFPGKAKRVIHLFMNGGPSHVDTFDPKPALAQVRRQAAAACEPPHRTQDRRRVPVAVQVPEVRPERHRGQRALPARRQHASTTSAVIRSMHADVPNHEPSLMLMNCGEARQIRPSMGSWVTYGLGTENQNLPGFIAMCPGGYPIQETQNWQSAFLPGAYQGTYIDTRHTEVEKLIENIRNNVAAATRAAPPARPAAPAQRAPSAETRSTTRSSKRASSRSSWPTACRWRPATPSTSAASRSTSATCTAPACRPGRS